MKKESLHDVLNIFYIKEQHLFNYVFQAPLQIRIIYFSTGRDILLTQILIQILEQYFVFSIITLKLF